MAHQASPIVYKDDYNKNVLGQGPANPAIAFPENDRLKKIHDQTSKVNKNDIATFYKVSLTNLSITAEIYILLLSLKLRVEFVN